LSVENIGERSNRGSKEIYEVGKGKQRVSGEGKTVKGDRRGGR